jgi:hypothetical protein
MAEWYTSDHVEQGKRDYAVSSGSSIKVSFGKGKSTNKNLHGGFGEMRLRRFIYWHGEFKTRAKWKMEIPSSVVSCSGVDTKILGGGGRDL